MRELRGADARVGAVENERAKNIVVVGRRARSRLNEDVRVHEEHLADDVALGCAAHLATRQASSNHGGPIESRNPIERRDELTRVKVTLLHVQRETCCAHQVALQRLNERRAHLNITTHLGHFV